MQACSGNAQDTETFKKTVKAHLKSLKAAYKNTYFIGDAALYVEETIKSLAEQEQLFITRVPQKIKEAKEVLSKINTIEWLEMDDGYSGAWHESIYGGVKQRWLVVSA